MAISKRVEYMVMVTLDKEAYHTLFDADKRPLIVKIDGDTVRFELNPTVAEQLAFTLDLVDLKRIVADANVS